LITIQVGTQKNLLVLKLHIHKCKGNHREAKHGSTDVKMGIVTLMVEVY